MKPKKREEKRSPLAKSLPVLATHQTGDGFSHGMERFLRQFNDFRRELTINPTGLPWFINPELT
jgi:hypothetical protein